MSAETSLEKLVRLCDGNLTEAATRLGVTRQTLYNWRKRGMNAKYEAYVKGIVQEMEAA